MLGAVLTTVPLVLGLLVGHAGDPVPPTPPCPSAVEDLALTVIVDNNPGTTGLAAEWGFACLVEGAERAVLLDTGSGTALLDNMTALGVGANRLGAVVLSHAHGDHTGGLAALLEKRPDLAVFAPPSVAAGLTPRPAGLIEVSGPLSIARGVCSTGEVAGPIPEQALVVSTPRGLVVITGCAHPGIVEVVARVKKAFAADVFLAVGGFHLARSDRETVGGVVAALHELGVRHVAPCHCSGEAARAAFGKVFGDRCHLLGVGSRLEFTDLP